MLREKSLVSSFRLCLGKMKNEIAAVERRDKGNH